MAAALLQAAEPAWHVVSAGLEPLTGHPADPIAQTLMTERGLDIGKHRAQPLTRELCDGSDVLLVMDSEQKQEVARRFPTARGKLYRLCEHENKNIFDPYRLERIDFEQCLDLIESGVSAWHKKLKMIL